jgi:DNA-binding NtrC family response regulator
MSESVRGQEVLILDADAGVQQGVYQLLSTVGLIVTALADPAAARKEVADRFFSVALVDVDTPAPGEGLGFLQYIKERSPATQLLVLSARRTFEMTVRAFRAGAMDVIIKEPDSVEYLKSRVVELARRGLRTEVSRKLLTEVGQAHEEFLNRLMEAARRIVDLEERIAGRTEGSAASSDSGRVEFGILVVDGDGTLADLLEGNVDKEGYTVRWAATGGEAFDLVGQGGIQLALVQRVLPDLPGSMVVKSIKQLSSSTIVLEVAAPGDAPGWVHVVETTRNIPLVAKLTDYKQILPHIAELREAYRAKGRERRYLRAFRAQHFDFIKRYVELKQRIAQALGETAKVPAIGDPER